MMGIPKDLKFLRISDLGISHADSDDASRLDRMLLLTALALTGIGLVMVYSASTFVAVKEMQADWSIFLRQSRLALIGGLALIFGSKVDVDFYRKYIKIIFAAICLLMALQLVFKLGPIVHDTRRWVRFGFFNLQTSEVARSAVVILLARLIAEDSEFLERPNKKLWKILGLVAIPFLLTNLQPDMSSSLVMAMVAGAVLFTGGLSFVNIAMISAAGISAATLLIMRKQYMIDRIIEFLSSLFSGEPLSYQSEQSLIGFGNGGILGVGLGQGKQKMLFLPEPHTDFIYSIIGEEGGLLATVVILAAFIVLFRTSMKVASRQQDTFKSLLAAGLSVSIAIYALINMGVAVGVLPITGLPLPFISNGGTSLVISLWSVGVLRNLLRSSG